MAELDGPRLEPRSGNAQQLVVFVHGYGADGNDLIDIGRAWQGLLPNAAFVSPHAPRPCGQAPSGREWFPLTMRALHRAVRGAFSPPAIVGYSGMLVAQKNADPEKFPAETRGKPPVLLIH